MSLPSFKPSQRRLLLGSAIALARFATPLKPLPYYLARKTIGVGHKSA